MKLYHSQFTRSGRARWMLEEVGASYDIARVALMKGEGRTPEYLAINPHGSVPSLVDGDLTLTESSAIVMHLADKFPEKRLAPAPGTKERGSYYQWLVYIPATVDPVLEALTFHTRLLPEDKRDPAVVEKAKGKWATISKVLEGAVDGRTYLVGDAFTAADVVMASAIGWVRFLGMLEAHPKLAAYYKGMQERPAYGRAYAD